MVILSHTWFDTCVKLLILNFCKSYDGGFLCEVQTVTIDDDILNQWLDAECW